MSGLKRTIKTTRIFLIILHGPFLGRVGIDEQKRKTSMVVIGEID